MKKKKFWAICDVHYINLITETIEKEKTNWRSYDHSQNSDKMHI